MTGRPGSRDRATRVWRLDLDAAAPALLAIEKATPRLSAAERARADNIENADVARRWVAAHIALRLVLEREVGVSVRRAPYTISKSGKPELEGAAVTFSLSHAAQHALLAAAPPGPLGVDIETSRIVRMAADRRTAIETGARALSTHPLPEEATARFLQAWVRIESVAKAEGIGLAVILARTGAYGPGRSTRRPADLAELAAGLALVDLSLGPGLFGAVAMAPDATGAHVGTLPADRERLQAFVLGD